MNGWPTAPIIASALRPTAQPIGTDNPDQRIAEDIRDFIDNTLTLGISLLANVVTLVSFLGILWSLSGTITLFGIASPATWSGSRWSTPSSAPG